MEEIKKKNKKLKIIAIVLFIVIVLLGGLTVFLYNKDNDMDDFGIAIEPGKDDFIRMFNSKFDEFEGQQRGTIIKFMLSFIMQSNNSNEQIVTVGVKDRYLENNEAITDYISKIAEKNIYEVRIYDSDNDEYIDKIFIRIKGEEATEEELKLEQIKQQREEKLKIIEQEMKREELKERIILSVIILVVVLISMILIIKTVKILKGNDENKKHKVLLTLVIIESVIIGGFLLFMLISSIPINTGII